MFEQFGQPEKAIVFPFGAQTGAASCSLTAATRRLRGACARDRGDECERGDSRNCDSAQQRDPRSRLHLSGVVRADSIGTRTIVQSIRKTCDVLFLPFPKPYDFALSTQRFHLFGPDLANLWDDGALYRAVGGREVRIAWAEGGVDVEPLDGETRGVAEKLLGREFELEPFAAWAAGQPVLDEIVPRFAGFRPPLVPDPFEALVSSITAQQVSLFSAFAIRTRFVERLGVRVGRAYAFPTRERVAGADEAELVGLGFSRRKAEYVIGLARSDLDLAGLAALSDDDVRAALVALRGLGPWTAEWFLARHLARPRAWPVGDLALRKAVDLFYGSDVSELGPRLDPFQNLSAHYLLTAARTP